LTRDLTLSTLAAIDRRILTIRGERVMLDVDLAEFYGTTTKALNQAVKRNRDRFPDDFMFRLTREERDQVVTICDHLKNIKYSRTMPSAFCEHGAIMAAAVLSSPLAVDMSVYIVRAFVRMRQILLASDELRHKVEKIERHLAQHDQDIRELVQAVKQLMLPPAPRRRTIGFVAPAKTK
jgi:hypothetical protein